MESKWKELIHTSSVRTEHLAVLTAGDECKRWSNYGLSFLWKHDPEQTVARINPAF